MSFSVAGPGETKLKSFSLSNVSNGTYLSAALRLPLCATGVN